MTDRMMKIKIESFSRTGRPQSSEYLVPVEVAYEMRRLQQLAQAWEEDARKYAARVDQLLKEQKWREPRNHWAI